MPLLSPPQRSSATSLSHERESACIDASSRATDSRPPINTQSFSHPIIPTQSIAIDFMPPNPPHTKNNARAGSKPAPAWAAEASPKGPFPSSCDPRFRAQPPACRRGTRSPDLWLPARQLVSCRAGTKCSCSFLFVCGVAGIYLFFLAGAAFSPPFPSPTRTPNPFQPPTRGAFGLNGPSRERQQAAALVGRPSIKRWSFVCSCLVCWRRPPFPPASASHHTAPRRQFGAPQPTDWTPRALCGARVAAGAAGLVACDGPGVAAAAAHHSWVASSRGAFEGAGSRGHLRPPPANQHTRAPHPPLGRDCGCVGRARRCCTGRAARASSRPKRWPWPTKKAWWATGATAVAAAAAAAHDASHWRRCARGPPHTILRAHVHGPIPPWPRPLEADWRLASIRTGWWSFGRPRGAACFGGVADTSMAQAGSRFERSAPNAPRHTSRSTD